MSIHVLSWVLRHSEARGGQRHTLIVLADHAKDDGTSAWPSVETIAHESRQSRRAVQEQLRALEADGRIWATGKSRSGTTVYTVRMAAAAEGGADRAPAQITASGGASGSPEPSIEPSSSSPPTRSPSPASALEPMGFAEWLGYHCLAAGRSVPRAATSARAKLAVTFSALVAEGYELEDFKLASDGVLADSFMVEHGHTAPENVLRKSKIAKRIDDGRAARRSASSTSKYDGLTVNA